MKLWIIYLRFCGVMLLLLTLIATYRDLIDDQTESIGYYVSRLIVMPLLGIGLFVRNRWVVRVVYSMAIALGMLLVIGTAYFGLLIPLSSFIVLSGILSAQSLLVLVPRDTLTGYSPFTRDDATRRQGRAVYQSDIRNPYQSPASILDSSSDEFREEG